MHIALLRETAPHFVGQWRQEQVFIPPHHDRIPELMRDLLDFVDRTDVPLLAQTAIAHARFETIHPFPDGNGRTGRAGASRSGV